MNGFDGEDFTISRAAPEGTKMVAVEQMEAVLRDTLRADGASEETIEAVFRLGRAGREIVAQQREREAAFMARVDERAQRWLPTIEAVLKAADAPRPSCAGGDGMSAREATIPCGCGTGWWFTRAVWISDGPEADPSAADAGWLEAPCPWCNGTGQAGPPPWPEQPEPDAWRPADPARVAAFARAGNAWYMDKPSEASA